MEWPQGWLAIRPGTEANMVAELSRELAPGHPLYGLPVRAAGLGGSGDDVLFEIADGSGRVAVAHLTWGRHPETAPWPLSVVYPSRAAWLASEAGPDAEPGAAADGGGR